MNNDQHKEIATSIRKAIKAKRVRGVAILTVMVSIALLMAIVTELSVKETLRYKLAVNERNALQAEALAQSGVTFAQIILTVQEPLQKYMATFAKNGMQLPAYTVWDLMPIDSDLLKGITDGSFMPDFSFLGSEKGDEKKPLLKSKDDDVDESKTLISDNKAKDVPLFGPYQAPEGGYGGFAGRFSTEIKDEESKISIRKWPKQEPKKQKVIADQIFRVLAKKENEFLFDNRMGNKTNVNAAQLVGNIYDYISDDERSVDISATSARWGLDKIGDKRSHYVDSPGITPKRAPMDTIGELRLVPGMTDAIFQLLNSVISIYAEGESINILSASNEVLKTVFYSCTKSPETSQFTRPEFETEVLNDWLRKKDEGSLEISADGIIAHLEEHGVDVDKEECKKEAGTASKVFTVKSTATVGTVTKTLLVRVRSAGGITSLYQYQYL